MTLQQKAQFFLEAQRNQDPRCKLLLMMLAVSFGLPESACQGKIEELARGGS